MTDDEESDEPDPFASVQEHEAAVEAVAEWDNALGATAQRLLAWSRGKQPMKTTVEASHFDLDVGSDELGRWTPTYTGPPPSIDAVTAAIECMLAASSTRRE
jgi:hypothetical protein